MKVWAIEAIHPGGDILLNINPPNNMTKEQFRMARLSALRELYSQVINGVKEEHHDMLVESASEGALKILNEDRNK